MPLYGCFTEYLSITKNKEIKIIRDLVGLQIKSSLLIIMFYVYVIRSIPFGVNFNSIIYHHFS